MDRLFSFQSSIRHPVGNGKASDPLDVISTRRNLNVIDRFNGDLEQGYFSRDLEQAIRAFQHDEGLRVDGFMNPGGETERALNRNLRGDKNPFGTIEKSRLHLEKNVGKAQENKVKDVEQVQKGLSMLGFLPPSIGFEPNGIVDEKIDSAIRSFQRKNDLRIDGVLKPRGETEATINSFLRLASNESEDEIPALPNDEIETETLPPPSIKGTDIPDEGVPEQGTPNEDFFNDNDMWRYKMDPDFEVKPPMSDPEMPIFDKPMFDDIPIVSVERNA